MNYTSCKLCCWLSHVVCILIPSYNYQDKKGSISYHSFDSHLIHMILPVCFRLADLGLFYLAILSYSRFLTLCIGGENDGNRR